MQLGEWVEFETIVIREQTQSGSQPTQRALPRTRSGMVVGRQRVYQMQAGTPPVLSQPQTVLIVAVSLHRRYRVFPTDARPTTVPATKTSRSTTSATATSQVTSCNTLSPVNHLDLLVADEINRRIAAALHFTAYDITKALRDAQPGETIRHADVRTLVHQHMETVVASQLYEREIAEFDEDCAIRYVPSAGIN